MKFTFSPHIAVQVRDYVKAADFYENVLGMQKVKHSEAETHFIKDGINFYMENSESGFTFFEFKVESVADAQELLEREGCKVTQVYNEKSKMIADPYGMRFHIWED
ncbi:MAG TPA: VOC family protein [Ignavibacteria bacterium]|nr:VOC family protein [Ignavibacteria bacterium]HRK00399.1 VOC family protein [Ignavibacteria bacterium]